MRGFGIGLVVGAVLIAAMIIAPPYLADSAANDRAEATALAQEARSALARYDASAPLLARYSEEDAGLAKLVQTNEAALREAIQKASAAKSRSQEAITPGEVLGTAQLNEAGAHYARARDVRAQQSRAVYDALIIALRTSGAERNRAKFAGLDADAVIAQLESDRDETAAQLAAATQRRDDLARQVSEREALLSQISTELRQRRDARLALEEQGFQTGSDAAFASYRDQYIRLSAALIALESREQLLRHGGLAEAEFAADDVYEGEIIGGERVRSLAELRDALQLAEATTEQLADTNAQIERQIGAITRLKDSSDKLAREFEGARSNHAGALAESYQRAATLGEQAVELEDKAIAAAGQALAAFKTAERAVSNAQGAARDVQSKFDPQRQNARLKQIVNDQRSTQHAKAMQAGAQALLGRIHADRSMSLNAQLAAYDQVASLTAAFEPDLDAIVAAADAAREEAVTNLTAAREAYTTLADRTGAQDWLALTPLAVVEDTLDKLGVDSTGQYASAARESIRKAIRGRTESPYLDRAVAFYVYLTGDRALSNVGASAEEN